MRKRHPIEARRGLPIYSAPSRAALFRILLLEDEPAVRDVLSESLARNGYAVLAGGSLEDGQEALDRLGWRRVDLVLTDTHLSRDAQVRNGFAFHAHWRARYPVPPFIFMDGWGGAAGLSLPPSDSCQVYALAKPFSVFVLLALMRAILGPERR